MIYQAPPKKFTPKLEVVGCFLWLNGKILLLHRQDSHPEGGTWGLPAGKIRQGEKAFDAVVREIKEETSLAIAQDQIKFLKKVYVKYPSYDFIFNLFQATLEKKPTITINKDEHKDFRWIAPQDASELKLIGDLNKAIKIFATLEAQSASVNLDKKT